MIMDFRNKTKKALRRENPTDSENLFNTVWRFIVENYNPWEVFDFEGLQECYDGTVSAFVNDPNSEFFIYG